MQIKIENKWIGEPNRCFVVAEAGSNHNGKVELAKLLIESAKDCGCDAVKFQAFKTENLVTKKANKAEYQKGKSTGTSQFEMLKDLELSTEEHYALIEHAKSIGIPIFYSVFDKDSADAIEDMGIEIFKLGSGELTNIPLIKHIAKKGKPIILSTGMSNLREIEEAVNIIRSQGTKDIILLHCITDYPAKIEDVNLRAMQTLRDTFKLPVGFSDHTTGITIPIAAVALGAYVIEKHLTLDKNLSGPDHKASLEPQEFQEMVRAIRDVEKALGNGIKKSTKSEEKIKKLVRRSMVAKTDIPKGVKITEVMLDVKRPGTGLEPKYLNRIIGKKTKRNIKRDTLIKFKDLV